MSLFGGQRRRVGFQCIGLSSLHCCVPQCTCSSRYNSSLSFHCFPRDPELRQLWLTKICRENFTPLKETRVCSRHFLPGDIVTTPKGKRRVKKRSLPVLFEWNNYSLPAPRPSVWDQRPREETTVYKTHAFSESEREVVIPDHDYFVSSSTGEMVCELTEENEALKKQLELVSSKVERLQLRMRFGLERFAGSDDDIRFYTRFSSYRHLQDFWRLIEPAVNCKMIGVSSQTSTAASEEILTYTKLPPVDELFLFLMYLSLGPPLQDLAERFGVHQSTVSRIIATWTTFLYHLLGSERLWLPREVVQARLPPEFVVFPDTQVVLDWVEIYCQTPADLLLQSEKSHSTLKAMIGMAPHGAVTFVSALYAGSMSEYEIFKQSGIVKVLHPDMAIMVNEGFLVDNPTPCKVYCPAFFYGKRQTSPQEDLQTQTLARLRVHVERCIRRVKENRLFDKVISVSVCGSIDELFNVACYLVNYQNGPLVRAT